MQGYGRTLITNAGSKMLTDVDGAKGKITYTKAVLYVQDIKGMSEDEQRALTEIDDEQMSTPIIVTDIKEETVTVSASFNNAKLTKDIKFNSIGWFAKTSVDDQERLLAVTPSDAEQTIVAGSSGASTSALDINMAFARNDNATVVIKPTEAGLINQAQLEAATNKVKVNLEAEISTQVNNITDQMKNFGKVKKVQGKEPDADGNVDITFGKIIKGWDMVNNTYDPSQTKNNDTISNIWPVDQMVIVQVVSKLLSTETSLKSEIAKKDNTADVDEKLRNKINIADLIGYISDHNGNKLVETTGNANAISEPGMYLTKGNIKNLPTNDWGILQVLGITVPGNNSNHRKVQIFYPEILNKMPFYRNLTNTTFSGWHQLATQDDIANIINQINSLGDVKKVNNILPDSDGNVTLASFENPDQAFNNNDTVDVDKVTDPGIYLLMDTTLICSINNNALNSVPGNTDGKTYTGYLVVYKHDAANITQELRIYTGRSVPDFTTSTRCIYGNGNYRPNFQRLITNVDYQDILGKINSLPISKMKSDISTALNRITALENREIYHYSSSLSDAKSYSANNPQVLVGSK